MYLGSLAALVAVISRPGTAFRRALHGPAVHDGRRRLRGPALTQSQDGPEVMDHGLEAAGVDPPKGLLVDRLPRREMVGHHAPRGAGPDHPPQGVEYIPQVVFPLRCLLIHEGEV